MLMLFLQELRIENHFSWDVVITEGKLILISDGLA